MIKKMKYVFSFLFSERKIRAYCAAVLAIITFAAACLLDVSISTVKVFDGEDTYIARTISPNKASVLSTLKLKSDSYNILSTISNSDETTINIEYTFPVYITNGKYATTVNVAECTVADALKEAGFTVDKYDIVEPSLDTALTETAYIDYTDIDYVKTTTKEVIPYKTNTYYSRKYQNGTTKTVTTGKEGLKATTLTSKYVNGAYVTSKITSVKTLNKAVDAVKVVGTQAPTVQTSDDVKAISTLTPSKPIKLDKNGVPVNYKSKRTARATAYTYTGNKCSTGVAPQPGYIAVNPKIIPYGTKMYIKTSDGRYIYGYAIAADTGGFIENHPTGVDLFLTSESACKSFGVRTVEIYILE